MLAKHSLCGTAGPAFLFAPIAGVMRTQIAYAEYELSVSQLQMEFWQIQFGLNHCFGGPLQ